MGMGFIGALAGLGQGIANIGAGMIENDRQQALFERQKELEQMRLDAQREMQAAGFKHSEALADKGIAATAEQGRLSREHQTTEHDKDRAQRGEMEAYRGAREDARYRESGERDERRHRESMSRLDRQTALAEGAAKRADDRASYGFGVDDQGNIRRGKWGEDGLLMAGDVKLKPVTKPGEDQKVTPQMIEVLKQDISERDPDDPELPALRLRLKQAMNAMLGGRAPAAGGGMGLINGLFTGGGEGH